MSDRFKLTLALFNEATNWSLPTRLVDRIDAASDQVSVTSVSNRKDLLESLESTQILVGLPITDDDFVRSGGALAWIQLASTTPDILNDMPRLAASNVRITTSVSIQAVPRAEHALMLTLALTRRLHRACTAQLEHVWESHELAASMGELAGQTVGLVGLGPVGREIAKRLRPFGVEIIATLGEENTPPPDVDELLPVDRLDELLARSDIIILAVPPTESSGILLTRSMLDNCQHSALLVNVSHMRVCDDFALADILVQKHLAGAALDTFMTAPLPENSPLWRMNNVIITPRVASVSPRYWDRACDVVVDNIGRFIDGRPLIDEWVRSPVPV